MPPLSTLGCIPSAPARRPIAGGRHTHGEHRHYIEMATPGSCDTHPGQFTFAPLPSIGLYTHVDPMSSHALFIRDFFISFSLPRNLHSLGWKHDPTFRIRHDPPSGPSYPSSHSPPGSLSHMSASPSPTERHPVMSLLNATPPCGKSTGGGGPSPPTSTTRVHRD